MVASQAVRAWLSGREDHELQLAAQLHCGSSGGTGERLLAGLLAKELCRQAREAFAAHAAAVMPIAFLAQQDEDSQIKVGPGLCMSPCAWHESADMLSWPCRSVPPWRDFGCVRLLAALLSSGNSGSDPGLAMEPLDPSSAAVLLCMEAQPIA